MEISVIFALIHIDNSEQVTHFQVNSDNWIYASEQIAQQNLCKNEIRILLYKIKHGWTIL